MRTIELTFSEWQSLSHLHGRTKADLPGAHRAKLLLLGVIAEKAGNLVVTFEGRLQLREHNSKTPSAK